MKRTYQPSRLKRKRRHGFRARKATKGGQKVLAARRAKGRKRLSAQFGRLGADEKTKPDQSFSVTRVRLPMGVIKKRRDFLAMRGADKAHSASFLMLARENPENGSTARLGLTVTKKLGNAVIRNRIRRRLRAAAREVFPDNAAPGADYVLVARKAAYDRNFEALLDDMKRALLRLNRNPTQNGLKWAKPAPFPSFIGIFHGPQFDLGDRPVLRCVSRLGLYGARPPA